MSDRDEDEVDFEVGDEREEYVDQDVVEMEERDEEGPTTRDNRDFEEDDDDDFDRVSGATASPPPSPRRDDVEMDVSAEEPRRSPPPPPAPPAREEQQQWRRPSRERQSRGRERSAERVASSTDQRRDAERNRGEPSRRPRYNSRDRPQRNDNAGSGRDRNNSRDARGPRPSSHPDPKDYRYRQNDFPPGAQGPYQSRRPDDDRGARNGREIPMDRDMRGAERPARTSSHEKDMGRREKQRQEDAARQQSREDRDRRQDPGRQFERPRQRSRDREMSPDRQPERKGRPGTSGLSTIIAFPGLASDGGFRRVRFPDAEINGDASPQAESPAKTNPPRYFVMRSNNFDNIEISQEKGVWATPRSNSEVLSRAFNSCEKVVLFYSVNESRHYHGYGEMASDVGGAASADVPWNKISILGGNFYINWIVKKDLPFEKISDLKNPWNENKQVKVSRDGQELPPEIAEQLIEAFEKHGLDAGTAKNAFAPTGGAPRPPAGRHQRGGGRSDGRGHGGRGQSQGRGHGHGGRPYGGNDRGGGRFPPQPPRDQQRDQRDNMQGPPRNRGGPAPRGRGGGDRFQQERFAPYPPRGRGNHY